jgi:predicted phosphoribosyltransferase
MRFITHAEAGQLLARLVPKNIERPVVLAIPPGGPRIGREVARHCGAPMDVLLVRDIAIPGRKGTPLGVVVDGAFYPDHCACAAEGVTREYARMLAWPEQTSEERWERAVRHNRPPLDIEGATVLVVSDVALNRDQLVAVREALDERRAARMIHLALFDCPGQAMRRPMPIVTGFTADEARMVMLVNAGYRQTTEDEIAELLEVAGA